jgi:Fe2+ or Zn2+ uptake regulation protein
MSDFLEMIERAGQHLTERQLAVLRMMRDQDEELVREGLQGWVGLERTSLRTVNALLWACAISLDSFSKLGGVEVYEINETGRKLLERQKGTK